MTDVGNAAIGVTGRRTDLQLVTSEIDLKKLIFIYSDGQLTWFETISQKHFSSNAQWTGYETTKIDLYSVTIFRNIFLQTSSERDLKR